MSSAAVPAPTFDADWLRLREPHDRAARREHLAALLDRAMPPGIRRIVDLGAGTGSNYRWLKPRLSGEQHWRLLDHDASLLKRCRRENERWGVSDLGLAWEAVDLRDELPELDCHAITCSALLDLVSDAWLERLADRAAALGVPVLAALTVDGRVQWRPVDLRDGRILGWFRAHQATDRGFGSSPGPQAAPQLAQLLAGRGFQVHLEASDWEIGPRHPEMLRAMVEGVASAAAEMADRPEHVEAWRQQRHRQIDQAALSLTVGHLDLLALPPS